MQKLRLREVMICQAFQRPLCPRTTSAFAELPGADRSVVWVPQGVRPEHLPATAGPPRPAPDCLQWSIVRFPAHSLLLCFFVLLKRGFFPPAEVFSGSLLRLCSTA